MSLEFKKYFILAIIFDKDLKKIILRKSNGKLDAFFCEVKQATADPRVDLSKWIHNLIDQQISPDQWRNVITLQQIEKIASTMIVCAQCDSDFKEKDETEIHNIDSLPENIIPSLKWIIPLCLDVSVVGSSYNQVIIR